MSSPTRPELPAEARAAPAGKIKPPVWMLGGICLTGEPEPAPLAISCGRGARRLIGRSLIGGGVCRKWKFRVNRYDV
jgi:hypothetical protein